SLPACSSLRPSSNKLCACTLADCANTRGDAVASTTTATTNETTSQRARIRLLHHQRSLVIANVPWGYHHYRSWGERPAWAAGPAWVAGLACLVLAAPRSPSAPRARDR